jgi:N-acetylglucosaminyldiphosphoundecaprenol N-acetyl-beta-D-mannosaminyltransferase
MNAMSPISSLPQDKTTPFVVTKVLGIPFVHAEARALAARLHEGGLIVAPSGPNLATIDQHPHYAEAVRAADFAIADSAWMVLAWRILTGQRLPRVSGLEFLRALLDDPEFAASKHLWIMPDAAQSEANAAYLEGRGIPCPPAHRYLAPHYPQGPLHDPELLKLIEELQPRYIIINLGGLTQERLGHSLRKTIGPNTAIICTGAAIAFLSGQQTGISPLADRFYIGWLLRCLHRPGIYIPRYLSAIPLPIVLSRWKRRQSRQLES